MDFSPWRLEAVSGPEFIPVACALIAKIQMDPKDRPKVKLECLRLLTTLKVDPAKSKLIGGFIESYLKLTASEMKKYERELAQFAPKETDTTIALVSSWEQRGIDKGISRGISQGKEQVVSRLILRRLTALPVESAERVSALTSEQLDDLADSLLDFTRQSDLERRLARNRPN